MYGRATLAGLCAALLAALVCTAELGDKRAEMGPAPFVLGSRYGRSSPRVITPRNDRFFMGSRYGKRSLLPPNTLAARLGDVLGDVSGLEMAEVAGGMMVCEFTGVVPLYRCLKMSTHLRSELKRNAEEVAGSSGVDQ